MAIFDGKTIVGLFDRERDAERAIAELERAGFDTKDEKKLCVLERHRLEQQAPAPVRGKGEPPPPPLGTRVPESLVGGTYNPAIPAGDEPVSVEKAVRDRLTRAGIPEAEAGFLARNVAEGAVLVLVETSKDRAAAAWDLLAQADARDASR